MTNQTRSFSSTNTMTLAALVAAVALAGCAHGRTPARATAAPVAGAPPMTKADAIAAQTQWCDALIGIGAAAAAGQDARAMAERVLSTAYAYDQGTVLFKPTLTHGAQTFRMDKAGALAYFVGGDPAYPDDTGFALKGWKRCTPEVKAVVADGDMAVAMGNVHFEGKDGAKVTVDKTFGYHRGADGRFAIVVHHSSLPYVPAK